jgi:hypothetical protein
MHKVRMIDDARRQRALQLVAKAPEGYVVSISEPKRSGEQNDKMWAMLGEISTAKPEGRHHTPDDWKAIFMNACGWECQFIEGLDGRPFPKGFRSSALTVGQMSKLIAYMTAFCAENNIRTCD